MTNLTLTKTGVALGVAALAFAACSRDDATPSAAADSTAVASPIAAEPPPGTLYGRVTTHGGAVYEGPLRWGDGEEAFWEHAFNGVKDANPWAAYVPDDQLAVHEPTTIFGIEVPWGDSGPDLRRPFMARLGDVARIESVGDGLRGTVRDVVEYDPQVRVTLKSGTTFTLDRLEASDFDDGVRVWDARRGVVDLGAREVHTIDLFAPDVPREVPARLYGTVHAASGDFTGVLQWNREAALGRDELVGRTDDGELRLRFDALRSITRDGDGVLAATKDGSTIALTGTRQVGRGNLGVYVDDPRYGRVLVPWNAFERVDFAPDGPSLGYGDFAPGERLAGTVTTTDGRRLAGRLVYDLDESETTETLDASADGIDYMLPFGQIASVALSDAETARVTLRSGEALRLDRVGDLGDSNAGLLVFADDAERLTYVPWADVEQIDFAAPTAAVRAGSD